jgi:competence ComEA-like helix-hairpin-helix protein
MRYYARAAKSPIEKPDVAKTKKTASVAKKSSRATLSPSTQDNKPKKATTAKLTATKKTPASKEASTPLPASPSKAKSAKSLALEEIPKIKAKKTAAASNTKPVETEKVAPKPRGRPKRVLTEPVVEVVEVLKKAPKRAAKKLTAAIEPQQLEKIVPPKKTKKVASTIAKDKTVVPEPERDVAVEKPKRGRPKSKPVEEAKPMRSKSVPPPVTEAPDAASVKKRRARSSSVATVASVEEKPEVSATSRKRSKSEIMSEAPEVAPTDAEFVITDQLVELISSDMGRHATFVRNALELLLEGNTVPFITRYRKEMLGEMDETHLRYIHKQAIQYTALQQRKQTVLETIRTLNKLSPELEREILETTTMRHLEDLYAPYKPKKNSLADVAIAKGLLPVAEELLTRQFTDSEVTLLLESVIDPSKDLSSIEDILLGIQHIWAEKASDSVLVRDAIRPIYAEFGTLSVSENTSATRPSESVTSSFSPDRSKKSSPPRKRADTYAYYFNFSKPLSSLRSHNVMAINRGEREKFLKVKFSAPEPEILSAIANAFAKQFPRVDELLSQVVAEFATMDLVSRSAENSSPDLFPNIMSTLAGAPSRSNPKNIDEDFSDDDLSDDEDSLPQKKLAKGVSSASSDIMTLLKTSKSMAEGGKTQGVEASTNGGSIQTRLLRDSILDGFKRLLHPSMVKEVRNAVTEEAEAESIVTFGKNLKSLLLKPPVTGHVIMGIDPGFTHGCKTCVVDENGKVLETRVIYPFVGESRILEKLREFDQMIRKHQVTMVAIGNGTAHKQATEFVKMYKSRANSEIVWCLVDESGASVYSVSPEAQAEFPDLDPAGRGAASIARRTLDPMAEIVKIPTQSIGVGSYQHDVNQKELEKSLSSVVEDCVNYVGVNLNTASQPLLRRVSGINPSQAQNIVKYRDQHGGFVTRTQLVEVKGIGPRAYTQCAGFLRIPESPEPLDNTNIHPESYPPTKQLLKLLKFETTDIIQSNPELKAKLHSALNKVKIKDMAQQLQIGIPTLTDIIDNLKKPGRDPRASAQIVQLDNQISSFDELKVGMTLVGRIVNVTGFGAFVDVGIEHSGLVLPKDVIDPVTNLPVKSYLASVTPSYVGNFEVLAVDAPRQRFNLRLFLTDAANLM